MNIAYTLLTKEQVAPTPQQPANPTPAPASKTTVTAVAPAESAPLDLTVTQTLPLHEPLVAPAQLTQPAKPASLASSTKFERYIIQVASFRNQQEAERFKAMLRSRGFASMITSVNQQQITWYRVLIGPFESRTDAERVHRDVAQREHITGMIRKLEG